MNEIVLTTNGKLSSETLEALKKALIKKLGADSIRHVSDPSLIGGFTVKYNGTFYDVSVASRLAELKNHVVNTEVKK